MYRPATDEQLSSSNGMYMETLVGMSRMEAGDPQSPHREVGAGQRPGDPLREGVRLGLIVASATWIWIAAIDAIAGSPFHAFMMLGGVVLFTAAHFLLNVVYGVVIVSAIHGAGRAPSLIIALVFGFVVIEIAFAMVTVLLSNLGMGELAWLRIFGGSLFGGAIALALLVRRHPLSARLREAEGEL